MNWPFDRRAGSRRASVACSAVVATFPTTQWSQIVSSRSPHDEAAALSRLCETYWRPLYAYVRRRGADRAAAEDAIQAFLADFIARRGWIQADRERGRFRTFLLACLEHHRANEHARARASKRDTERTLSLDVAQAERALEPIDLTADPEVAYRRHWALTVLESVEAELRGEYERRSEGHVYDALRSALIGDAPPYRTIGDRIGRSEGAVKVAVHRLRHRFGALVRARVADTVADTGLVDDELQGLLAVLRK